MPGVDPISIGLTALGLGSSFFGRHKFHMPNIQPFSYTPDPNDPEIDLRRRLLLGDIGRNQASTTNEIARAGLLGSGASFGIMEGQNRDALQQLEGINSDVFTKRRAEALNEYDLANEFKRQLALQDAGFAGQGALQESAAGLEGLSGIGEGLGSFLFNPKNASYWDFLHQRRNRNLPVQDLFNASQIGYQPDTVSPRGL